MAVTWKPGRACLVWIVLMLPQAWANGIDLVSEGIDAAAANGASYNPVVSAAGRYVAFSSNASNLVRDTQPGCGNEVSSDSSSACSRVYLKDLHSGEIKIVSVNSAGEPLNAGSKVTAISADGRYVLLLSRAANVSGVEVRYCGSSFSIEVRPCTNVFLYDALKDELELINVSPTAGETWFSAQNADISDDGRWVAFSIVTHCGTTSEGCDSDLYLRDRLNGETLRLTDLAADQYDSQLLDISGDGAYILFKSSHGGLATDRPVTRVSSLYRYQRATGYIDRVNVSSYGDPSNNSVGGGTSSRSGKIIAFDTSASNMVVGDYNGVQDVFVRDVVAGTTERISVSDSGVEGNGISRFPSISRDGRYVVFVSDASNLVIGDDNDVTDLFLHDRKTGETELISQGLDGLPADDRTIWGELSAGSNRVVFSSRASNLVDQEISGTQDVYSLPVNQSVIAWQESPSEGSDESGIGLLRGWACEAEKIELVIDGGRTIVPGYGTSRGDTRGRCGDSDNGYGYTVNWNVPGAGVHRLQAYADGIAFASVEFNVADLGVEYLRGVDKEVWVDDFPEPGQRAKLRWSQAHQGFVLVGDP